MIEIAPIRPANIDSFHWTLDFVSRERRFLAHLEAPPIESTRSFVMEVIKRGYPQFVALSAAEVVGWCDVLPKSRPVFAHVGVLGIGLLPEFRRQGIGTLLVRRTLDAARDYGLSRVELSVREDNESAVKLYKRMGFATEGLQRNALRIDGVYEDLILMALLL